MSRPRVKVAVVGSGLAGLTAAYRLCTSSDAFEVHLFEKESQLGMDSSSVTLDCGTKRRVDVPMRSFQGGYYPNLIALYKEIGAAFRVSNFTYSFSCLLPDRTLSTTLLYNGSSGSGGVSMPSALFPEVRAKTQPTPLSVLRSTLLYCIACIFFAFTALELLLNQVRLFVLAAPWFRPDPLSTLTFEEWISRTTPRGYVSRLIGLDQSWVAFVHDILLPLFSAVCTAGTEDVLRHPAAEFLDYCWATLFTHHYVAEFGVRDVVARLSRPIHHIHLSTHISSFSKTPHGQVVLTAATSDPNSDATVTLGPFSHIIIATQANQALHIVDAYSSSLPEEDPQRSKISSLRCILAQFYYVPTLVVNHSDTSLLPRSPADQRDLNLVYTSREFSMASTHPYESDLCVSNSYAMATHILSANPTSGTTLLQTTNPIIPPRQDAVLSVARLQRAVVTPESKRALQSLAMLHTAPRSWRNLWRSKQTWSLGPAQGARSPNSPGIWVCGSYAHGGIPLLEGCVVSATNVAHEIIRLEAASR